MGVLCYELLNGSPPFETNEEKCTKAKISKCDYKLPSNMNELAKDLIKKILVPRASRISVEDIAAHDFVRQYMSEKFFSPKDPRLALVGKRSDTCLAEQN